MFQSLLLSQCQALSKLSEAVHIQVYAELFCNISFHGERTQTQIVIFLFCSLSLSFICCLSLLGYKRIK